MPTAVQSSDSNKYNAGTLYIGAYIVMASANAVFAGNLLQSMHLFPFLFWSFVATSLFFMAQLVIRNGVQALAIERSSLVTLLAVNVTGALNWISYFYALKFIEPAVAAAIIVGIGPLSTIAAERIIRKRKLPAYSYIGATGILLGATLLAWASFSGLSGMSSLNTTSALLGFLAAIVCGLIQVMSYVFIKQLGNQGWSASRIIAHRFYVLILVAMVLSITGPGLAIESESQIMRLAIATIIGVIIPLWALQRGILHSEPFMVAALFSLGPMVIYIFQGFDGRIEWSAITAYSCAIVAMFTYYCLWMQNKQARVGGAEQ